MSTLTGWRLPFALNLRRDRWFWILWTVALASIMPLSWPAYAKMMPDDPVAADLLVHSLAANTAMLAMLGPAFDLSTKAGFLFWREGGFLTFFAAMMAGLAIIRCTRAEEDAGRLELLRAGRMGRHAPLFAAVLSCVLGSLFCGVVASGWAILTGLPVVGSIAYGLGFASLGILFTALGAALAQISSTARIARLWTVGVGFGGMFLARMLIDGQAPQGKAALWRWAVPLEWPLLARPWANERWWVYVMTLAVAGVGIALAFVLEAARDHQSGLIPERQGRATAPGWLRGSWGLAWRLQRGSILSWFLGIVIVAAGLGSMAGSMFDLVSGDEKARTMMEAMGGSADMQDSFYVAMLGVLVVVVGWMAIAIVGQLRTEELATRTELMLSTAQSRWHQAGSHVALAVVAPSVTLLTAGVVLPLGLSVDHQDSSIVREVLAGSAALIPGVVFLAGLTVFLYGLAPRLQALCWLVLGWALFCAWFAAIVDLPEKVAKVQPWGYLPKLPAESMRWQPIVVETAIGVLLLAIGMVAYRRRDVG